MHSINITISESFYELPFPLKMGFWTTFLKILKNRSYYYKYCLHITLQWVNVLPGLTQTNHCSVDSRQ